MDGVVKTLVIHHFSVEVSFFFSCSFAVAFSSTSILLSCSNLVTFKREFCCMIMRSVSGIL